MVNMKLSQHNESIKCLCCNTPEELAESLIQINEQHFMCKVCSSEINGIFNKLINEQGSEKFSKIRKFPKEIKKLLDKTVIGQEEAKKALSVEIYNHYKRICNEHQHIQKSNILMIGDSGTGKTLLVQTLSKILDLPLVITDCTALTQAGYVGADIESILQQLVIAADGDIEKAQHGIIMLDEIDKIAKRNLSSSTDKDPSGEGVQQGLLKILEGTQVKIKTEPPEGKGRSKEQFIDTTNILFIGAGAFFGLDKVVEKKLTESTYGIGFSASVEKPEMSENEITDENIIDYGFIPEFVGRLPVIVQLNKLTKEDYRRILTEPANSILSQYQQLLAIDDISLEFTPEFLDEVVDSVFNTKRGARALRSSIEKRMCKVMFELSEESIGTSITV
jgi:ATP-dependent Clp protease ATP-binding subunit ClpX